MPQQERITTLSSIQEGLNPVITETITGWREGAAVSPRSCAWVENALSPSCINLRAQLTTIQECGRTGGAVYSQVRLQVLRDGLTQRSRGCVLLRQTLQTCCFDEPGGEQTTKNPKLKRRTLVGLLKLTWTRQPLFCHRSSSPLHECDSEPGI